MYNKNNGWVEIPFFREIEIIIMGFLGGIITGITIKTGVSIDRNDWSIMILNEVCKVTERGIPFNCNVFIIATSLVVAVLAFFSVWEKIVKIKKNIIPGIVIGLMLYCIGVILAALTIIKLF